MSSKKKKEAVKYSFLLYSSSIKYLSKYKYITNEPCAYGVDKKGKGYLIDIKLKDK